ncbi:hypothetical protein BXZ70DRAFT_977367 [Cristinia sonorae]|uniref:Protein kinase domain-containing protein n=1 Tax=Cristinia sonorae TaxID=1940300 RepID=A0A8K0UI46_9AGAR|nr:hypothetical protein BXZ70DRAFT_977367 [Cristinia sonorae]
MWGDGEYGTTTHPQYSTLDLWAKDTVRPIVNASCCPTFIIATTGAWLTILGWAITADVEIVVQPLIDIMWLGEATLYEDTHVYNVARVFAALRKSLHDLEAYYRGLALEPTPNTPSPASFPHPTTFTAADGSEVQFRYLQRLEDDAASVTFLAETVKSGASENVSRIVVKFVDRYGADAHRLLARANLAPALLYFGALDGKTMTTEQDVVKFGLYVGPIRMVVMEFVDGSTVADDAKRPDNAKEKLTNALRVLHAEDYVFGDLRAPNVMFTKDGELRLIDFNWAGKDGVATYPRRLSTTVRWAAGVEEFGPMRKEHDLEMLERLFPL